MDAAFVVTPVAAVLATMNFLECTVPAAMPVQALPQEVTLSLNLLSSPVPAATPLVTPWPTMIQKLYEVLVSMFGSMNPTGAAAELPILVVASMWCRTRAFEAPQMTSMVEETDPL